MSLFFNSGNGYIEGAELDNFLFEFVTSVCRNENVSEQVLSQVFNCHLQVVTPAMLEDLKADFLDAYDENDDHRIEIKEVLF